MARSWRTFWAAGSTMPVARSPGRGYRSGCRVSHPNNLLAYSMSILPLDSIPVLTLAHLVAGQQSPAGVPEEQWNDLVELALDHGLGGMLLWSLRQAGWAQAAEPRWQPLVDASRRNGRHNLLIEKARRQAAAALDPAGIPTIWLKGIALAHTCYPEI